MSIRNTCPKSHAVLFFAFSSISYFWIYDILQYCPYSAATSKLPRHDTIGEPIPTISCCRRAESARRPICRTSSPFWTRATPFPSLPATARRRTARWTTRRSARSRRACNTCRNLQARRDEVKSVDRVAGQADGRAVRRHRRGRDARRGRGPLPALQAKAPHPRDRRPRKGARAAGRGDLRADARHGRAGRSRAGLSQSRKRALRPSQTRLQGANDIIAEQISDDAEHPEKPARADAEARRLPAPRPPTRTRTPSIACTTSFHQPVAKLQSHQILALNRGEKEGFLKVAPGLGPRRRRCSCSAAHVVKPGTPRHGSSVAGRR